MNKLMTQEMTQTFMDVFYLQFRTVPIAACVGFVFKIQVNFFILPHILASFHSTIQMTNDEWHTLNQRRKWAKTHNLLMGKCDAIWYFVWCKSQKRWMALPFYLSINSLYKTIQFNKWKRTKKIIYNALHFFRCYLSHWDTYLCICRERDHGHGQQDKLWISLLFFTP